MITISYTPGQTPAEVAAKFNAQPGISLAQVQRTMYEEVIQLQRLVVTGKLQGQVLHHRTGHLGRSIIFEVTSSGYSVSGMVGVGKEAPYGKVHELGGTFTIPEHPVRAYIRKTANGSVTVRAHEVRSHQATYPERSFLRTALQERLDAIIEAFRESLGASLA